MEKFSTFGKILDWFWIECSTAQIFYKKSHWSKFTGIISSRIEVQYQQYAFENFESFFWSDPTWNNSSIQSASSQIGIARKSISVWRSVCVSIQVLKARWNANSKNNNLKFTNIFWKSAKDIDETTMATYGKTIIKFNKIEVEYPEFFFPVTK